MSGETKPVAPITPNTVYLTSLQVRQRYGGRSRAWLPRAIKQKGFPKPYRLGGGWYCYWRLDDVERWEAKQQPDATPRPRRKREAVS